MDRLRRKRETVQPAETKSAGPQAGGIASSRARAATRGVAEDASIVHKAKEAEKEDRNKTKIKKSATSTSASSAKAKVKNLVSISSKGKENAGVSSTRASKGTTATAAATTTATTVTRGVVAVPPRPKLQAVAKASVGEGPGSPRKRKKTETPTTKQGAATSAAGGAGAMSATKGEDAKRARCQAQEVPERPSRAALAAAAEAAAPTPTPCRAVADPISPRSATTGSTAVDYALVPFVVSTEQALATFAHWKSTLWFAPSDLNEATEAPTVVKTWVPYHEMTVAIEATLVATTSTTTSTSTSTNTTPVTKTPPRVLTQQVSCELTGNERIVMCAAQSEEERRRLKNVEDEEVLFASESLADGATQHRDKATNAGGAVRPGPRLSKEGLMRLVDGELRQRLEQRGKAEICQHHQVAGVPMKEADIKQLKMDKLRVRIEKDRAVLIPIYTISYYYGSTDGSSSTAGPAKYVFLVNGITSKCWGERPWGMGALLSKGIGALGSIFGTDDDDRIGLVEGSQLRRIDGCSHYERDSVYLVFPPSHSYLITSATGWIRLKNSSDAHHVELLSWPRKGERPLGRFTLAPGQEEVFDYRGRWCIEVRDGGGKTSPIQVIGFDTTDGGGYGNKLCMHYASLF